ncbi:hypothetical protein AZOA_47860 [Azoarcus sp. Aa7]|nr:hypothetical protein [Azoarcus sp. Aa7]
MPRQAKRAAPAKESARPQTASNADSIPPAPLYHPLTWRSEKPAGRFTAKADATVTAPDRVPAAMRIDPALIVVFEPDAVARLLQLRAGASVSLAGMLKVGTYQAKDGTARPSLDLQADEVASTTPRPRKAKESPRQGATAAAQSDPFGDLPGAGDIDWTGA